MVNEKGRIQLPVLHRRQEGDEIPMIKWQITNNIEMPISKIGFSLTLGIGICDLTLSIFLVDKHFEPAPTHEPIAFYFCRDTKDPKARRG